MSRDLATRFRLPAIAGLGDIAVFVIGLLSVMCLIDAHEREGLVGALFCFVLRIAILRWRGVYLNRRRD